MSDTTAASSEARGRRRGRPERGAAPAEPTVRPQPRLPFKPVDIVSADQLEAVHQAALKILSEIGIDVLHAEARAILKEAGADVAADGARVRFDPALVEAQIGMAPENLHAACAQPGPGAAIGGDAIAFCSVASAPNAPTATAAAGPATRPTSRTSSASARSLDAVHLWGGYPVEPADIHASVRHLDALFDMLTLSDKPIHAYSLGRQRNLDAFEMVQASRAASTRRRFEREPSLFTIINSSSPLRLDDPDVRGHHRRWREAQPGDGADAVHAGRRHGAGDDRGRGGAAERRGAGRARAGADRAAGLALRLWRLHLERRHEVRRAGLRHARIHEGGARSAASSPAATACPTARPTPMRPTRSTPRRPTRACSRSGAP